jgi:hypothetical protein
MGGDELEVTVPHSRRRRKGGEMGGDELEVTAPHIRRRWKGGDEVEVTAPGSRRRGKELDAGGACCALQPLAWNCAPAATAGIAADTCATTLTHSLDLHSSKRR